MKPKLEGLVSMIMIALAMVAVAFYGIAMSSNASVKKSHIKSPPDVLVPDRKTLRQIDRFETRMANYAQPRAEKSVDMEFALLGNRPAADESVDQADIDKDVRGENVKDALPVRIDYKVTFAFTSNDKRFCMIDGALYTEGAFLPGDGKVIRIQPHRVLVQKLRFQKWISVSKAEKPEKDVKKGSKSS